MKRISEGLDHGLLGDICKPRSDTHRYVVIAYCQNFTRTWQDYSDGATVRRNFQTLYDQWFPGRYIVGMAAFSFNHDNVDGMMDILNAATVFHMGGVHGREGKTCLTAPPVQVQRLIATLKAKVQQNDIAYIGICGGAKLVGRFADYIHTHRSISSQVPKCAMKAASTQIWSMSKPMPLKTLCISLQVVQSLCWLRKTCAAQLAFQPLRTKSSGNLLLRRTLWRCNDG